MSIGKRLTALLLAGLMVCAMMSTAWGEELPDLSKTGEITLRMKDGDTVVPGGSVSLYQVGELVEEQGAYTLTFTDPFLESQASLDDLESSQLPHQLADYASDQHLVGVSQTISDLGTASFSDLPLGLYLVVQTESNADYELAEPFLVSLPQLTDGSYLYTVEAAPKLALSTEGSSYSPVDEPVVTAPVETEPQPVETTPVETTPVETTVPTPSVVTPSPSTVPTTNKTTTTTTTAAKLPQTGQLNWPIPVLVMAGFLLMSLGYRLRREDKDAEHET
jgi:cell division septation protein DedD